MRRLQWLPGLHDEHQAGGVMSRLQLKRDVWLATAAQQARLSTCLRAQVGCVLLRQDGSVAGTGYNGSLPGYAHCEPQTCNPSTRCLRTRHAERSALDYSLGPINAAYVTHEPCLSCLKDLLARDCKEIYFLSRYPVKDPVEANAKRELLKQSYLSWTWTKQDGTIRTHQTGVDYPDMKWCSSCNDDGCDECGFLPVPK